MALRAVVVGVRFGAAVHVPALRAEGVDVVAVCASRIERARDAARSLGVAGAYADVDEMLRAEAPDVVTIATPVPLHVPMAEMAIRAGSHVLVEKPLAPRADDAAALVAMVRASGRTAMMGHEFRYTSARRRAKELVAEGYVGDLRMALVRLTVARPPGEIAPYRPFADDASLGGGLLLGQGSHYVDALRDLFGDVAAVSGRAMALEPARRRDGAIVTADAEDTFLATLEFAAGGIATIVASRALPFTSTAGIEIYGSEGALVAPQPGPNPAAHGRLLGARIGDAGLAELEIPARLEPPHDDRDDRIGPFRVLVRDFVDAVARGVSAPPSIEDGYRCQQVLDAVRASGRTGERVVLDLQHDDP